MNARYNTGVRFNHNFGVLETLSFVGEGVGAALYILSIATGQIVLAVLGIAFVIGALFALRAHLGKPMRGWRALTRFATSWVSRGSVMMACFLAFASLSVAAAYLEALAPYQTILSRIALVFSVGVLVYAGMLLRTMQAIHLWRGPLVPLAFSAHSLASGSAIAWALLPWLGVDPVTVEWLPVLGIGCLLLGSVLSGLHLALAERSAGVQASLNRLLAGDLRSNFIWAAGVLGIVVSLLGLLGSRSLMGSAGPNAAMLLSALVAACRLYGDYAYRNSIVVAGAYEPVLSTSSRNLGLPFSRS
jgi:DMSO reductase anchor subunit